MNKIGMIFIVILLSGCGGATLESRINYSFTDKSISKEYISRADSACDVRFNTSGIMPRYKANIFANNEIQLDIDIVDPKTKVNFFGPGILVPLPFLPWPPGLFESAGKETLSIRISFATQFAGYSYNPEESYISINGNTYAAKILSETSFAQLTVTDPLKDNRFIYTPYLHTYDSSIFMKVKNIYLNITGLYKNETPIKIQPIELELLNITELYWASWTINC